MDRIDKPWGYEEILVNNGRYVIKKIFVNKKHRLSLQAHKVKSETLLIHKGKGVVTLDGKRVDYDVSGMPKIVDISIPGTVHRIVAVRDTVIYEVSTPELDDVIRIEDDYGRA